MSKNNNINDNLKNNIPRDIEEDYELDNNKLEKKIILYILTIAVILIFIALFFIHDIISNPNTIKNVEASGNNVPDNTINSEENKPSDNIENSGGVNSSNNGINSEENNQSNNTINSNGNNSSNSTVNSGENKPSNNEIGSENNKPSDGGDDIVINNTDRFHIKQGSTEWKELKELDMFKNSTFQDRAIIAPGVTGKYNFTIENDSDVPFNYKMSFTEENPYNVNMVYKLKSNGVYVLGSENEWATHEQLTRANIVIDSLKTDLYTVEWRWEDTDYDTQIGETEGANYKMHVEVDAEQIVP